MVNYGYFDDIDRKIAIREFALSGLKNPSHNVSERVLARDEYLRSRPYKEQARLELDDIRAMNVIGGHRLPAKP